MLTCPYYTFLLPKKFLLDPPLTVFDSGHSFMQRWRGRGLIDWPRAYSQQEAFVAAKLLHLAGTGHRTVAKFLSPTEREIAFGLRDFPLLKITAAVSYRRRWKVEILPKEDMRNLLEVVFPRRAYRSSVFFLTAALAVKERWTEDEIISHFFGYSKWELWEMSRRREVKSLPSVAVRVREAFGRAVRELAGYGIFIDYQTELVEALGFSFPVEIVVCNTATGGAKCVS